MATGLCRPALAYVLARFCDDLNQAQGRSEHGRRRFVPIEFSPVRGGRWSARRTPCWGPGRCFCDRKYSHRYPTGRAAEWIESTRPAILRGTLAQFAVVESRSGELIGCVSLKRSELQLDEAELAYWMASLSGGKAMARRRRRPPSSTFVRRGDFSRSGRSAAAQSAFGKGTRQARDGDRRRVRTLQARARRAHSPFTVPAAAMKVGFGGRIKDVGLNGFAVGRRSPQGV